MQDKDQDQSKSMSKLDLSIIIKFVDKATQPIRQFQQNVQSTNQSLDRLTHSIDRLERSLNGGRSFQQYSRNLKVGTTNINQNNSAVNTIHGGYDRVATVLDKVRNKTQEWTDTLKANRAEMRQEFKALAINSVIAGAGLYKFFQPAIDFEKQMSGVQSVLDLEKQSAAMKQLTADARKWGAASSFSPGEAAQAQFALGSGGFNADQIHKALGGTLQLAEAGKVELERAAQIAVGTLNGFGLAADKINHVNDVFLKGTNLTATSVDGLGETMKYVAPIAKAYGVSIEQATAMTGLLGNNNILDTQAGTSLRSIMTRFAGPPKEAAKAFDKLKIKTVDAKGNMRDIADILADVNKATKNLGTGQRLDIFKDIAGQEAVSAFAVLVDESVKLDTTTGKTVNNIKLMTKELENSEGAAARAAKILKDNLAGDIEQLGGSIQDLSISLLNVVGTDIRTFVSGLGNFIDKIKDWVDANPQLVKTIANLVLKLLMFKVAMLGVRYTSNLLFGTIFSMIAGITKFALIMWFATKVANKFGIGLPNRFILIAKGVKYLGRAFMFLSKQSLPFLIAGLRTLTIALLTNPFTLIIASVATLALLIWKYWGPIKAFFVGFWDGLKIGFSPLIDSIGSSFAKLKTTLSPLLPVWNVLATAFNWVKQAILGLFTPFQATNQQLAKATENGKGLGVAIGIFLGLIGTAILKIIEFGASLINGFGKAIGIFAAMIVVNIEKLPQLFQGLWLSIQNFFKSGIANISATILNWSPLGLFYSVFAKVLSWFGIDLPKQFTGFGSMIIQGLIDGIKSKFDGLKGVWEKVTSYMPDFMRRRMDIHSPSRVMAGLGGHIVDGIGVGLNQRTPALQTQFNHTLGVFDASPAMPSTPTLKRRFTDSIGITETPVSTTGRFDDRSQTAPKFKRVAAINSPRSISVTNSDNITIHINAGGGGPIRNAANEVRQALAERDRQRNADLRRMLTDRE